jgi:serine/threonine-protein kinase HipA
MINWSKKYQPIKILNVFYSGEKQKCLVGQLAYKNNQIWFEYDSNFISKNLQLSPLKLPLQKGVFSGKDSPFSGLFGLFNDSLPDGWGKLLLDRQLASLGVDYRQLSPLDRLAFVGSNGMGALQYFPNQDENDVLSSNPDLNLINREVNKVLAGETSSALTELYRLGGSSAGARPKVLIGYNPLSNKIIHSQTNLPEGYQHWIVKFSSSTDHFEIGKIEQIYSLMAKDAGIEMAETNLFEGDEGFFWFGTNRFDKLKTSNIHMHSAAGLLHADHRYPSLDYETLLKLALVLNKNIGEATKLFRLACFNVFANNRDDHSKNFSFIMNSDGIWNFAPAYDLTFSSGPGGEHCTTINGEGKNPSQKDLMLLAIKFKINNPNLIIEQAKEAVSKWPIYAKDFSLDKNITNIIAKSIAKNILNPNNPL